MAIGPDARRLLWLALLVPGPTSGAGAQFGARARVQHELPSANAEDATAAGTEVEMRGRPAAAETVSDVLVEVPGARPFKTGTLGSFTSASLRGAEFDHTLVLLGELPLSGADAAAFDLSTIPVSVLDGAVVYRGAAPVWVGQGAIGGVLQLLPKRAEGRELSATATAGSFGTLGVSTAASLIPSSAAGPRIHVTAGAMGSDGDFVFRSDENTSLDSSDDRYVRRRNADTLDGHGLLHLSQRLGPGDLQLVALGFERVAGEPASASRPALRARRNFTRGVFALSYTGSAEAPEGHRLYRMQAMTGGAFTRSRFWDPFSEVGTVGPNATDDVSWRAFGRLAGSYALARPLELTGVGELQHERFEPEDALALVAMPDSERTTAAGAGELRLHGELFGRAMELRPSVRIEHTSAGLAALRFGDLVTTSVDEQLTTARIAAAAEVVRGISLTASVASGRRMPSMLELFGDGALLLGNTSLSPERSRMADVGVVASGSAEPAAGLVELRAFALDIDDMIHFVRNSLREQTPRNLRRGRIRGLEAGVRGTLGDHFYLSAATTLLDTEGKAGKRLPNRARVSAHVRPELRLTAGPAADRWVIFGEANVISATFDDEDNVSAPRPSQLFINGGSGLSFLDDSTELRVTVRDVFDRGGFDIRGFQLPGRTVLASLTIKEGL